MHPSICAGCATTRALGLPHAVALHFVHRDKLATGLSPVSVRPCQEHDRIEHEPVRVQAFVGIEDLNYLRAGGVSVRLPWTSAAAIPMDSLSVGWR